MTTLDNKDPQETKRYTYDLTSWMEAMETSITSIVDITLVDASGSPVTVVASEIDGFKINVVLAGGTAGTVVPIAVRFSSADGQILKAVIEVPIEEKA